MVGTRARGRNRNFEKLWNFAFFANTGLFILVSNVYLHFLTVYFDFQCLFKFLLYQHTLFSKIFETLQSKFRKLWNFALFANIGLFILISNVCLHFFDVNKLCLQKFSKIWEWNFENSVILLQHDGNNFVIWIKLHRCPEPVNFSLWDEMPECVSLADCRKYYRLHWISIFLEYRL